MKVRFITGGCRPIDMTVRMKAIAGTLSTAAIDKIGQYVSVAGVMNSLTHILRKVSAAS